MYFNKRFCKCTRISQRLILICCPLPDVIRSPFKNNKIHKITGKSNGKKRRNELVKLIPTYQALTFDLIDIVTGLSYYC